MMDSERWQLVSELFHEVLATPPQDRRRFLESRTGSDIGLLNEVLKLVEADGRTHALLDAPSVSELPSGMRIGPYAIERVIGSGGSATVYLARRADRQFDKRVAVKLVNQGFAAELTDDRVQTERQILARLEHPHIARLLDAGLSEFGQPYLVMEWVDGVPADQWIAQNHPSIERRLDLWAAVADAVSYAHRNLIVHRDLKPSNVLVARDGIAKLVDFGIAKLLADPRSLETVTETVRFTPRYASPEQMRGEPISTATDVFQLGLLLCEWTTGVHPFRHNDQPGAAGLSCDFDAPVVPSETPADLAAIIRMALREDPARRYASVAGLADDVQRFRRGLPVVAQPETITYRVRRFVGRHPVGVSISAAAVVVLLTSVAVSIGQARAAAEQAQLAGVERDRASLEAKKTDQINRFLQDMLGAADPARAGRDVRVADLLDRAGARAGETFRSQPSIEAEIRTTLARTYQGLGLMDPALVHARAALALREQVARPNDPDVAHASLLLADVLSDRGEYPECERLVRRALAIYDSAAMAATPEAAGAQRQLGEVLNEIGQFAEAERRLRQSISVYRQLKLAETEGAARAMNDLGVLLGTRGSFAEAEPLHREALRIMRVVHGAQHLMVAETLHNVAGVVDSQGRYAEAEALYAEVLAIELKLLGEDHAKVILTRTSLANLLWMEKAYDAAAGYARTALASANRALPERHPLTAYAALVLGQVLTDGGRPVEGERHLRRALKIRRELLGDRHWLVANTTSVLGGCLTAQRRFSEAEPLLLDSYRVLLADRGPDHEKTRDAARRVTMLYKAEGRVPPSMAAAPPITP
jgi:serine/threonine-protein kinase